MCTSISCMICCAFPHQPKLRSEETSCWSTNVQTLWTSKHEISIMLTRLYGWMHAFWSTLPSVKEDEDSFTKSISEPFSWLLTEMDCLCPKPNFTSQLFCIIIWPQAPWAVEGMRLGETRRQWLLSQTAARMGYQTK